MEMKRSHRLAALLSLCLVGGLSTAAVSQAESAAKSFTHDRYPAEELLQTCQQADNDSRRGAQLEIECEQYLIGYLDALKEVGHFDGKENGCPPTVNTPDEARWAFMRWVHKDYSQRSGMPTADAVLAMLPDMFPCE